MSDEQKLDLAEIERRREAAHQHVADLCTGKARWKMSIPYRPADSDALLSDALRDSKQLLEALQARDAEVQALREALKYALHVLECLKAVNPNPMLPHSRWKSVDMARAALGQEAADE